MDSYGTGDHRQGPAGAANEDLHDDGRLMGRVAGGLWLLAAFVSVVGQLLPGSPRGHATWTFVLGGVVLVYAVACLAGWIAWERTPIAGHAAATAVGVLVIGLAIWSTGGRGTYLTPLLTCPVLFVAFFFPARFAWALVAELVLVGASPLIYETGGVNHSYPARTLAMVCGFAAVTVVIQRLKQRLVDAEGRQRAIADEDALTGIGNRRAFDRVLAERISGYVGAPHARRAADVRAFAVLFIDVDDFKQINDVHGHPAGDAVLRTLAARFRALARPGDLVARIGGDEFAVIADGVGSQGRELAERLAQASGDVRRGSGEGPIELTVACAIYPDDGTNAAALMRAADFRLHRGKRARATRVVRVGGPAPVLPV